MKNKLLCTLAILLCSVLANADQSEIINLNDEQPYKTIQLTDERHEPIYETQPYEDTCSREVLDHHETRCHTTYEERCSGGGTSCSGGGTVCTTENDSVCNSSGCHTVPRRSCHTSPGSCHSEPRQCSSYPRESCNQYPIYRTEYYSCTRYREVVVGQRLVKTFKNEITVALSDADVLKGANLSFLVRINEDRVAINLQNSFSAAALKAELRKTSSGEQNDVITSKFAINITAPILGEKLNKILAASIADVKLGYSNLSLTLKEGAQLMDLIKLNLALGQDKPVISDRMKFSGIVPKNAMALSSEGNDLKISINLSQLSVKLKGKKHNLSLAASLMDQDLINKADFKAAFEKSVEQKAEGVYPQ